MQKRRGPRDGQRQAIEDGADIIKMHYIHVSIPESEGKNYVLQKCTNKDNEIIGKYIFYDIYLNLILLFILMMK